MSNKVDKVYNERINRTPSGSLDAQDASALIQAAKDDNPWFGCCSANPEKGTKELLGVLWTHQDKFSPEATDVIEVFLKKHRMPLRPHGSMNLLIGLLKNQCHNCSSMF